MTSQDAPGIAQAARRYLEAENVLAAYRKAPPSPAGVSRTDYTRRYSEWSRGLASAVFDVEDRRRELLVALERSGAAFVQPPAGPREQTEDVIAAARRRHDDAVRQAELERVERERRRA